MLNSRYLKFLPYEDNDKSGILKPVFGTTLFVNKVLYKISLELINPNFDCKTVYNHIYDILSPNILQRLVVEGIIDHIIKNKRKTHLDTDK